MAVIKCPDCGKDVSTEARACPHCGRPSAPSAAPTRPVQVVRREAGKYEAIGALVTILGVILGIVGGASGNTPLGIIGAVAFVGGLLVFLVGRFK